MAAQLLLIITYFTVRIFIDGKGQYEENIEKFYLPGWEVPLTMLVGLAIVVVI